MKTTVHHRQNELQQDLLESLDILPFLQYIEEETSKNRANYNCKQLDTLNKDYHQKNSSDIIYQENIDTEFMNFIETSQYDDNLLMGNSEDVECQVFNELMNYATGEELNTPVIEKNTTGFNFSNENNSDQFNATVNDRVHSTTLITTIPKDNTLTSECNNKETTVEIVNTPTAVPSPSNMCDPFNIEDSISFDFFNEYLADLTSENCSDKCSAEVDINFDDLCENNNYTSETFEINTTEGETTLQSTQEFDLGITTEYDIDESSPTTPYQSTEDIIDAGITSQDLAICGSHNGQTMEELLNQSVEEIPNTEFNVISAQNNPILKNDLMITESNIEKIVTEENLPTVPYSVVHTQPDSYNNINTLEPETAQPIVIPVPNSNSIKRSNESYSAKRMKRRKLELNLSLQNDQESLKTPEICDTVLDMEIDDTNYPIYHIIDFNRQLKKEKIDDIPITTTIHLTNPEPCTSTTSTTSDPTFVKVEKIETFTFDEDTSCSYDRLSSPISKYDYTDTSSTAPQTPLSTSDYGITQRKRRGRPPKTQSTQPDPEELKNLSESERKYKLQRYKNNEASRQSRLNRKTKQEQNKEEEMYLQEINDDLAQKVKEWTQREEKLKNLLKRKIEMQAHH